MRELIAMPALCSALVAGLGFFGVRALDFVRQIVKALKGCGCLFEGTIQAKPHRVFKAHPVGSYVLGIGPLKVAGNHQIKLHALHSASTRARTQAPEVPVLPRKAPIERQAA